VEYGIVIPAHNEEQNLFAFVRAFLDKLPARINLVEVIIVENGSTDRTLDECYRLAAKCECVRVLSIERASYGAAIKHGLLNSRGTHVSVLECDCLDVDFVSDSVELFQSEDARFIVASKRHARSIDQRPLKRRILTAVYNEVLLRLFLGYPGTDTHGLKSIEVRCAKQLCELAVTSDEIFQTELVLLAWRLGVTIHERPLVIREVRRAPVAVFRRVPKVVDTIQQLKRSLGRFSEKDKLET
jgi:glycosyltransferase involved in cell wall biosynthesis